MKKRESKPMDANHQGLCQWIEGEPVHRVFCGRPTWSGPWCMEHYKRVHLPLEQQVRRAT